MALSSIPGQRLKLQQLSTKTLDLTLPHARIEGATRGGTRGGVSQRPKTRWSTRAHAEPQGRSKAASRARRESSQHYYYDRTTTTTTLLSFINPYPPQR